MMNKIILRFELLLFYSMVLSTLPEWGIAQDIVMNRYGVKVITRPRQLARCIKKDPANAMSDLKKKVPGIMFDLRYATTHNFMHRKLYPSITDSWMRLAAADSLAVIQKEFGSMALGLKVFDAYRPYSVTAAMWETVKDDRYAADPRKGSGHNRGIAVDLTLVDLSTSRELDMGTGFDDFSDTTHHDFKALPQNVLHNRSLLKNMMMKHGFKPLETEWWHYSLAGNTEYELLDLGFRDLKKLEGQLY